MYKLKKLHHTPESNSRIGNMVIRIKMDDGTVYREVAVSLKGFSENRNRKIMNRKISKGKFKCYINFFLCYCFVLLLAP